MKKRNKITATKLPKRASSLFEKVAQILETARQSSVRAVNNNMVIAYWLIGREIVEAFQSGDSRAEYGEALLDDLSSQLTKQFGSGFSSTNLKYFRQFYQVYSERGPQIRHSSSDEFAPGVYDDKKAPKMNGFSSNLSWTHYRILSKVENQHERLFYEIEAEKEGWSVAHLERQIHSFLFARLRKSKNKKAVLKLAKDGHVIKRASDIIKEPYILDFLGVKEREEFRESDLESAIITHLQEFLLELGKGFAFVGRQKRVQFDDEYFFIDLVFYNTILKCYLLIDLKMGKLTHQDVGQMDSYVRMFDELSTTKDDNPTIGLILCSEKNEVIAKYSVLREGKQIFASKYMLYLPTEKELREEVLREKKLLSSSSKPKKKAPPKKRK